MNELPDDSVHRRMNLLFSLMVSGWLILVLAVAIVLIIMHGRDRRQQADLQAMQQEIRQTGDRVAALTDMLVKSGGRPQDVSDNQPAPAEPANGSSTSPTDNTAAPADNTNPTVAQATQPKENGNGYHVRPSDLFPDPNRDRPQGLAGWFWDLDGSAEPDPDNPFQLLVTGPRTVRAALEALSALGDKGPAQASAAKISADQQLRAAHLFLQTASEKDALLWANAVIAASPDDGRAHLIAGLAQLKAGQNDAAIATLTQATKLMSDRPEAWKALGEANAAAGNSKLPEAIAAYRKAVELVPRDLVIASRLAELLVQNRQIDEGVSEYRRILHEDPSLSEQRAKLATLLVSQKKAAEALAVLDGTPENAPPHVRLHLARGHALMLGDKQADAETAFGKAVELAPLSAEGWHFLGLTRLKQGKNGAAVQALEQAIAIDSENPASWEYLGVALANQGEVEKAIAKLREATRLQVASAQTWYILALLYARQNQADQAVEALKKSVAADASFLEKARKEVMFTRFAADTPIAKYLANPTP